MTFEIFPPNEKKVSTCGFQAALQLVPSVPGHGGQDGLGFCECLFESICSIRDDIQDRYLEHHGIVSDLCDAFAVAQRVWLQRQRIASTINAGAYPPIARMLTRIDRIESFVGSKSSSGSLNHSGPRIQFPDVGRSGIGRARRGKLFPASSPGS